MFKIRYASELDKQFWFSLDEHISENEFKLKIRDQRGYIISDDDIPVGILRYNLFWDNLPFLTLIHLKATHQGQGFGKQAMLFWEAEMRNLGHKMVMTSTRIDEQAQYFYRKLGYQERGSICFDNTPLEQPPEILMLKVL